MTSTTVRAALIAVLLCGSHTPTAGTDWLSEPDPRVRKRALESLVYPGEPPLTAGQVRRVTLALTDAHPGVRLAALDALVRGGASSEIALRAVMAALGDEDARVAEGAAAALGRLDRAGALLPAVLRRVRDGRPHAAVAAASYGRRALPALIDALAGPPPGARSAGEALRLLGPAAAEAVPVLARRMRAVVTDDSGELYAIAETLAEIGEPAVPRLILALGSADTNVSYAASYSLKLMELNGPAGRAVVEGLLASDSVAMVDAVRSVLIQHQRPPVGALKDALRDERPTSRARVLLVLRQLAHRADVQDVLLPELFTLPPGELADALMVIGELAAPVLIAALSDPRRARRLQAARGLERVDTSWWKKPTRMRLLDGLLAMVRSANRAERHRAIAALLGVALPEAAPELARVLCRPGDPVARALAANTLRAIGARSPAVAPAMLTAIDDPSAPVRAIAATTLPAVKTPRNEAAVRAALRRLARDPDVQVRRCVASALGQLDEREEETLVALTTDPDVEVRSNALSSLVASVGPRAWPVLVVALDDRTVAIACAAAESLGSAGVEVGPAVPALVARLRDAGADADVRVACLYALAEIGGLEDASDDWDFVQEDDAEARQRTAARKAVRRRLAAEMLPALIEALSDADDDVRYAAFEAIGYLGPDADDAVPALARGLRVDEHFYEAACSLAMIRTEAAAAALAVELESADDTRVDTLVDELANIGPNARVALPVLLRMLDGGEPLYGVATAIASVNPPDSVLVELLRHPDESVREEAIDAMGWLGKRAMSFELQAALVALLRDEALGEEAAGIIAQTHEDDDAAALLLAALRDPRARAAAVSYLGQNAYCELMGPWLLDALEEDGLAEGGPPEPGAETWYAEGVTELLANAEPRVLLAGMRSRRPHVRRLMVEAAGFSEARNPEVLEGLVRALGDVDPDVAEMARRGLVDHVAIDELVGALGDADAFVQRGAEAALARLAVRVSAPRIARLLSSPDATTRRLARRAFDALPRVREAR